MDKAPIEKIALNLAASQNLLALDMGSAHNKPDGYLGVDQYDLSLIHI